MDKKIEDYLHFYLGAECLMVKNSYHAVHELRLSADQPFKLDGKLLDYFTQPTTKAKIKPIIRPLSSMTQEEILDVFLIKGFMTKPEKIIRSTIEDRFIQIEYSHLGVFGSDWQHIATMFPEQFKYLTSKHFDLFGLIESNLAIDKTKQQ